MDAEGMFVMDNDGRYTAVDDSVAQLTGYERDEILGADPGMFFDEEQIEWFQRAIDELRQVNGRGVKTVETSIETAEGDRVPIQVNLTLVPSENGEFRGIAGNVRDISERKQREEKLEAYATALETAQDGIAVFALQDVEDDLTAEDLLNRNYESRYLVANRAWAIPVGFEPEELIGQPATILEEQGIEPFQFPDELLRKVDAVEGEKDVRVRYTQDLSSPEYGEMVVEFQFTLVQDDVESPLIVMIARDVTRRMERERELKSYERIFTTLGDGVYVLDSEGRVVQANDTLIRMFGLAREEVLGQSTQRFYDEDDYAAFERAVNELLENEEEDIKRVEATLKPPNGEPIPIEVTLTLLPPGEDGEFRGTAGAVRDMTLHRQRERERDRFETLLRVMPDTVVVTDTEGIIQEVHGFTEWAGFDRGELKGTHISETMPEDDVEKAEELFLEILNNESKEKGTYEMHVVTNDGQRVPHESHLALLPPDEDGYIPGTISVLRDITEQKRLQRELRRRALYDELTGLPNRSLFVDRLETRLQRLHEDPEDRFAVVYMDLDRFKMVNDSLGHPMGDELLKGVANRLEETTADATTVARLGGDEFAVLLGHLDTSEDALNVAEQISRRLKEPFNLEDEKIFTTASLGVVVPEPEQYQDTEALLRDADIAMYRSKNSTASYTLFEPGMHRETEAEMKLEMQLQDAIDNGELEVHYQPVLRVDEAVHWGFEALVRWNHPERGYLTPGEFLPLAKKTGFMLQIDRWVLKQACRHLAEWRNHYPERGLFVSVNCSQDQLMDPAFVDLVEDTLQRLELDPEPLYLEITERSVVGNPDRASSVINTLQEEGVHIVLDDFGTGYSSLSYLSSLPIDVLEVDRAFVYKLEFDDGGDTRHRLVRVIMNMAESLDPSILADKIEVETMQPLLTLGDTDAPSPSDEGFRFARALKASEVESLIGRI